MKLKILVGSMTGNAEYVAQAIELDCQDLVNGIEVVSMADLTPSVFDGEDLFLVCTSTYGSGDVPDNARAFYDSLESQPRYLGHVRYGVVALGDSSYSQTFAFGGKRFDERLRDLGAVRLGELCVLDASHTTTPEEDATLWCREWLSAHAKQAAS